MENDNLSQERIIAEARSAAADKLITPWWYHPSLGLLAAGYVVGLSLLDLKLWFLVLLPFLAGIFVLMLAYRKHTGVWAEQNTSGTSKYWMYASGVVVALAAIAGVLTNRYTDAIWLVAVIAVVVLVSTVVLGRTYDRVLRADLRSGR